MVFTHDMADWLSFNIDENWLEENISWKDFGTGVRLGKLKREEKTSLVLYEAQSEVEVDAFMAQPSWWRMLCRSRRRSLG